MMLSQIKDLLLDEKGKIIPARTNQKYLEKQGMLSFIEKSFPGDFSLPEKIYCITHNIKERPKCTCGNIIKFINGTGYSIFCSRKCASNDPNILSQNKKSVSKALLKVYKERGNEIKEKRRKTLYENFGEYSNSPGGISIIRDQIKKTILKKYDVDNIFKLKKYRSNGKSHPKKRSINQWNIRGFDVVYKSDSFLTVYNACDKHPEFDLDIINFYNRAARGRNGIICPICNPINSFSSFELEFENIIKKFNIPYIKNDRKRIRPQELDFYFPNFNLAIELNGLYWHSEIFKDNFYHADKNKKCSEVGIQLIQIWEDDFYIKKAIIESMIKYRLNKIENNIYARKCEIKNISSNEYRIFLGKNHLQGVMNSSVRLGLFFSNELIAVMGFGKLRRSLGNISKSNKFFELQRFATKINTNVIGGASKLLTYFEKTYAPKSIISYAKKDYSSGKLYQNLGFSFIKESPPGYYWIVDGIRKHRFSFRKDRIIENKEDNRTAIEIMHDRGFIRAFDSGNLKFEKNFSENY